ncbi:hypothetical protein JAAARDRAFT_161530 [Jaapia argillacea MUCL 33604]|uniref:Uncharacterized protein n=1 Tax=Jaapia argillacea MUCL 33604 TaxID=933084 RepID=A0A067PFE7_9AGAM|nr:hypothetical protein JAAARDRAFT_161530 [Jaapia argillacea MUCL 33604]
MSFSIRSLRGSVPGQLDPSQPTRLLRLPGSTLSFASFHPQTASSLREDVLDLQKLSLNEELYRPKRVVIETTPDGRSFWRFVPKAKREPGVEDEGIWPRVIDICGIAVECSQDQWDIYKLDSEYECLVQLPPKPTIITRRVTKEDSLPSSSSQGTKTTSRAQSISASKRRFSSPSLDPDHGLPHPDSKKMRKGEESSESDFDSEDEFESAEEEQVEEMIVDEIRRGRHDGERTKAWRAETAANRKERRERTARKRQNSARDGDFPQDTVDMVDLTHDDDGIHEVSPAPRTSNKPESAAKRKNSSECESLRPDSGFSFTGLFGEARSQGNKRARTRSPASTKRHLDGKRSERQRKRREELEERKKGWRQKKFQAFMDEILKEVPESVHNNGERPTEGVPPESGPPAPEPDDEAKRQAVIEESRRKLADLERDRPIWEQAQRERVAAAERALAEERRKLAERQRQAQLEREKAEREQKRREQEQEAARRREQQEREERSRRMRQQKERWSYGLWTTQRALERYKVLAEAFDSTKFTRSSEPLSFDLVPWPVLHSPVTFTVEDIDWTSVENFFAEVKRHMRGQDYKTFVEKSHRRFHPDRWRGRGLFDAVLKEDHRSELEVAANTVAQAITPIWREAKGR